MQWNRHGELAVKVDSYLNGTDGVSSCLHQTLSGELARHLHKVYEPNPQNLESLDTRKPRS